MGCRVQLKIGCALSGIPEVPSTACPGRVSFGVPGLHQKADCPFWTCVRSLVFIILIKPKPRKKPRKGCLPCAASVAWA